MNDFLDIENSSFDIYSNSEGENDFLDIENSSFDVYSKYTGIKPLTEEQLKQLEDSKKTQDSKRTFDAQKFADTVTALGSLTASGIGLAQAYQDPEKKAQKKSLRDVCGRRPLSKNKRTKYNECVANYSSSRNVPQQMGVNFPTTNDEKSEMTTGKKVLIGILVIGVIGAIGYMAFKGKNGNVVKA